ncbi:unnamed protein product [Staurois parvus]|uniref:Uncharacterized protein n=1 Tax=Staurois parvus TaxID=386267 RepID=A0ABN9ARD6_9NEOB|nr:unnamed protein product [Staurois parvus]
MISALMIGAQQCTHLCHPAVHPPVSPSSATHLCPSVQPSSAASH